MDLDSGPESPSSHGDASSQAGSIATHSTHDDLPQTRYWAQPPNVAERRLDKERKELEYQLLQYVDALQHTKDRMERLEKRRQDMQSSSAVSSPGVPSTPRSLMSYIMGTPRAGYSP
jgi:flagellar motility protein MotE (MotC chaperone)